MTPSRSTEIPWGSPGGPPEGHLANPWKFSGGTHGHPWITSGDPLKAWKVPIGIPSRNVAGTRIPGFQRLPRVFPLGKTLGKSSGSPPPHFSSGVSPGGKTGGVIYPGVSPGVSPGGLSTYPGFSPHFSSGVSSGGKPWVFTQGFPWGFPHVKRFFGRPEKNYWPKRKSLAGKKTAGANLMKSL